MISPSPRYRAPECLLTDGFYDYNMDMWSVGCVMFEVMRSVVFLYMYYYMYNVLHVLCDL